MEAFQLKLQRMKNYKQQLQFLLQKSIASPQFRQLFLEYDQYQMIVQVLIDAKSDKISLIKQQLRLFGLLAERAYENFSSQLPIIFNHLLKRIQDFESMNCVYTQVAEIIGKIVKHRCYNQDIYIKQHFQTINESFKSKPIPFIMFNQSCLIFIITNLRIKCIVSIQKIHLIVNLIKWKTAIILSVEEQSDIFADEIIPHLQLLLQNQLWQVKKMALNILYSLVVLQKDKILEHYFFKDLMYELKSNKVIINFELIGLNKQKIQLIQYQMYYIKITIIILLLKDIIIMYVKINHNLKLKYIFQQLINNNYLIILNKCTNQLNQHTDEKLQLIIDAILFLSGILRLKGICDSIEIQQIDSILSRLNERDSYKQPILKFSQCADSESFISKEAAEILREFKEKQISEYLR
ncbi:unnamed protein product [Paramecium sonneborni]|uniref:Uncharacterized protein n=1 Tax=Paramecium sonneborni TaxID=65129 RepID=A0A8S1RKH1_9CILI|nr:unnamed protein product [Paramecium sonneborni]